MFGIIAAFSLSKNNQKKYIDSVTMFCDSSPVLLADADEIRVCE
jgi:hypothetical protein